MTDRHIAARALEIAKQSGGDMYWTDAVVAALTEIYGDDVEQLRRSLAQAYGAAGREYKKSQYHLDPNQTSLFDMPTVVVIETPLGDQIVHSDQLTAGQVETWLHAGERYHGSQHKVFKARRHQVRELGLDPSRNYMEQLKEIRSGSDD